MSRCAWRQSGPTAPPRLPWMCHKLCIIPRGYVMNSVLYPWEYVIIYGNTHGFVINLVRDTEVSPCRVSSFLIERVIESDTVVQRVPCCYPWSSDCLPCHVFPTKQHITIVLFRRERSTYVEKGHDQQELKGEYRRMHARNSCRSSNTVGRATGLLL